MHAESVQYARDMIEKLNAISRESLSDNNRYAYDTLMKSFEMNVAFEDYYYYDEPLTPLNGTHTLLPLNLICFNIRTLDDVESYLYLVEDIARVMDEIGVFEGEKAAQGLFMSETALDQVVESCRNFAEKGANSFLISYFEEVAAKAKALGASESQCAEFRQRNRDIVLNKVLPAYSRLADTLEAHRAQCSEFVGASQKSAKAVEFYKLKLQDEGATTDDMDTVSDLLDEMGQGTYIDFCLAVVHGGDDILEKYENGADAGLGSIENNLNWLRDFVAEYYPDMPDFSLKYIDVPDDIADDFSPAAYLLPAYDDFYDNLMLINRSSEGSDDIFTIAHEALPGHMYQYLNARSNALIPLSQQINEPGGYAEAWTVFTEAFVASKCFKVGINYGIMLNGESTFVNIYLPASISMKVNLEGWTLDDVEDMLSAYGLEEAADIFYEYAVTMPFYSMNYAIGYSYMYDIVKTASPSTPAEYKAFFEKYLSYGPSWMDLMRGYMTGK